jgi:FkbM family methyltransferase
VTDYSQYGEQVHILEILKDIQPGRFLEIGAWDPKQFSNTRALYELGWSGVMVEPSPGPMRKLAAEYGRDPRIELVQAAVVTRDIGKLVRLEISDDAFSTTEEENSQIWAEKGGFFAKIWVPSISVKSLLKNGWEPDFVSIDTEGTSGEVFAELVQLCRPRCICVEHDGNVQVLSVIAQHRGYQVIPMNVNLIVWR